MKWTVLALLLPCAAQASITILSQTEQDFSPPQSSDLVGARQVVMKKKVLFSGDALANAAFETDVRTVYTTREVSELTNYAIVQRVRGCKFDSYWDGSSETRELTVFTNLMGNYGPFVHKSWEVDNDYMGPVYTGEPDTNGKIDLFSLLYWNVDPASLDPDTAKSFSAAKPTHPTVFATDLPGSEQLYPETQPRLPLHAENSSLEFQTCLFNLADLPQTTDLSGANVPWDKAIHCFSWDHKFIYDFSQMKFNSPASIDPICEVN